MKISPVWFLTVSSRTCILLVRFLTAPCFVKRAFDVFFALMGFVLLSPLFLLGSVLAKWQSKGPVFYKAKRVGKGGALFAMYKFRTMVANADRFGSSLTTYRDARVTSIGRFLRWTKLDELPNLINVIKGEMSLIGPRPEAPAFVKYYTDTQKQVLQVKPGMTGPAQLANRNEAEKLKGHPDAEQYYITELMPQKLALDLRYVATQSIVADIGWLLKTFWTVIFVPILFKLHRLITHLQGRCRSAPRTPSRQKEHFK